LPPGTPRWVPSASPPSRNDLCRPCYSLLNNRLWFHYLAMEFLSHLPSERGCGLTSAAAVPTDRVQRRTPNAPRSATVLGRSNAASRAARSMVQGPNSGPNFGGARPPMVLVLQIAHFRKTFCAMAQRRCGCARSILPQTGGDCRHNKKSLINRAPVCHTR
jgi:hypothetical protein